MTDETLEVKQTTKGFNLIFIHSSLDDADLTPQEFRVFAHLARRASDGKGCFASIDNMATVCKIHKDTLVKCLKTLTTRGMAIRNERPGKTTLWWITPPDHWILDPTLKTVGVVSEGGDPPETEGAHPPETKGDEGNTRKGIKEGRKRADAPLPSIPDALKTPEFEAAWNDWIADRKTRGKKVTALAAARQLKQLEAWGVTKAIQSIEKSIRNGYQGLFEPHDEHHNSNGSARNGKPETLNTGRASQYRGVGRLVQV